MESVGFDELMKLAKLKQEDPEGYKQLLLSMKEIMIDLMTMMQEVSKEM